MVETLLANPHVSHSRSWTQFVVAMEGVSESGSCYAVVGWAGKCLSRAYPYGISMGDNGYRYLGPAKWLFYDGDPSATLMTV